MPEKKNPVIGLTGGIASGKSTVAKYLRKQGFHVIDADKLGHRVLEPGQPSYQQVIDTFGREIINADGTINRRLLGNIVFNNPAQLEQLNQISHPLIAEMIVQEVEKFASHSRGGLVFLEAAILLETQNFHTCQQIWVVVAEPEVAIARLRKRNRFTQAEAQARLEAQWDNDTRRKYADVLIENNGPLPTLFQQVDTILAHMKI